MRLHLTAACLFALSTSLTAMPAAHAADTVTTHKLTIGPYETSITVTASDDGLQNYVLTSPDIGKKIIKSEDILSTIDKFGVQLAKLNKNAFVHNMASPDSVSAEVGSVSSSKVGGETVLTVELSNFPGVHFLVPLWLSDIKTINEDESVNITSIPTGTPGTNLVLQLMSNEGGD